MKFLNTLRNQQSETHPLQERLLLSTDNKVMSYARLKHSIHLS
eukprot:UN06674